MTSGGSLSGLLFSALFGLLALTAPASDATAADAPPSSTPVERVGDALDRPAVLTRRPTQAVLLAAAQAGARVVAVGERGTVIVSDDGAVTWQQVAVPVSVTLTSVRFTDATHGFAVGHGGVVLSTTDAGQTWARRLDGRQAAALALQAAQAGGDAQAIKNAERLVADGPDKPFFDLHFRDSQHGIVVGAYSLAFETSDGGQTWQPLMARLDNPKALHLYAVRARGDTLLIAGEQGLVLRSDDQGRSFRRLEPPYKGSFFTAELPSTDGRDVVLAGLRGNVWRSQDGGASWQQQPVPAPASITGSALRPGGGLWLVTQGGMVLRSAGDALVPLPGAPLPPINGVLPLPGGGLLALTVAGLVSLPAPAP